jgi:hypothetical protein
MSRVDEASERDGAPDAPPRAAPERARRRAVPVPSPAVVGQRLLRPRPAGFAQMQRGRREWQARRQATLAAETAALLEAPLAELVTRVKTRTWTAITMHLLGATLAEIAAAVGFTQPRTALTLLRRPESQRLITLIRQAQLQKILEGEYGVMATAKAAAPRIMAQVAALAGGVPGPDGGPRGRAKRDADTIRAADLALTIAGHKVERQAHLHVHLLEEMSWRGARRWILNPARLPVPPLSREGCHSGKSSWAQVFPVSACLNPG